MKIAFYCPRGTAGAGGLSRAADDLQQALLQAGVGVRGLAPNDPLPSCDLIHFHGIWNRSYPKIGSKRIPYVVSPHGMLEPWALRQKWWKKAIYFQCIEKAFLTQARLVMATSQMEAGHLRKLLPGVPCRVAALGMTSSRGAAFHEARQALNWNPELKVILFLSRLHHKKGLHLLLQALRQSCVVPSEGVRLVVIGGGADAYAARLRKEADRQANALPAIEWRGALWTEEKWKYLQGADLFCLPSYSENFGLAVLEAAQVGTPVLTTDETPWESFREQSGFFIARPTAESIRQQLEAWWNSLPWDLTQRGALAERIHRAYSWKALLPDYLEIYREAVEGQ